MSVNIFVGTAKGAWVLRSDDTRASFEIEGPTFKGWKATAATRDANGRYIVATASDVYGCAVHVSEDLREFRQLDAAPAWPADSGRKLNQIWKLHVAHGAWWAGVDDAGLFKSTDEGASWESVASLNDRKSRCSWHPGFGGLCLHSIVSDPSDAKRLWVGISAVGVFRTDDGGTTWIPCNDGVPVILEDKEHDEVGFCVHGLAADPGDPMKMWRQDHVGMFRTVNGGAHWERCENGLPSAFGFPVDIEGRTGAVFLVPLEADQFRIPVDGKLRVYRSLDGGDEWAPSGSGMPDDFYGVVLRGSMAIDGCDPAGVYVGTTAGTVHISNDLGESWSRIDATLPRVLTVEAFAADAGG